MSRKNLTRFEYKPAAFQGWRLTLERKGTIFKRYFSDKKYGGGRKALKSAEDALKELRELIDNARLVDGKLSKTTINKAKKLLAGA